MGKSWGVLNEQSSPSTSSGQTGVCLGEDVQRSVSAKLSQFSFGLSLSKPLFNTVLGLTGSEQERFTLKQAQKNPELI